MRSLLCVVTRKGHVLALLHPSFPGLVELIVRRQSCTENLAQSPSFIEGHIVSTNCCPKHSSKWTTRGYTAFIFNRKKMKKMNCSVQNGCHQTSWLLLRNVQTFLWSFRLFVFCTTMIFTSMRAQHYFIVSMIILTVCPDSEHFGSNWTFCEQQVP